MDKVPVELEAEALKVIGREVGEAVERQDWCRVEELTNEMIGATGLDDIRAHTSIWFRAYSQVKLGKLKEAELNLDLLDEIRKNRTALLDFVDVQKELLRAEIKSVLHDYRAAELKLLALMRALKGSPQSTWITECTMKLCILYFQSNKPRKVYKLLSKNLDKIPDLKGYGELLRKFWIQLATMNGYGKETSDIVRLLLDREVRKQCVQKLDRLEVRDPSDDWTTTEISAFLQTLQNITLIAFDEHKQLFEQLEEVVVRFNVSIELVQEVPLAIAARRLGPELNLNNISEKDFLEGYFLIQAQAAFLGAIRTAAAGQFLETQMILRGALESALYCFWIDMPDLRNIWFDRHNDADSLELCREKFSMTKIRNAVLQRAPDIGLRVVTSYDELIDLGAHPNSRGFKSVSSLNFQPESILMEVSLVNKEYCKRLLEQTLTVGDILLEVFSLAIPACIAAQPKQSSSESEVL